MIFNPSTIINDFNRSIMSNMENKIQNSCVNKDRFKIKELKLTSKGRHIIKPKKLLTTSSDDKQKRKKKIRKAKSTDVCKELNDLQACAQPNILKDITFSSNIDNSKGKRITLKTSHDTNNIISRRISTDTSLSYNNYYAEQSVKHDTSHTLPKNVIEVDSNISCNDHNLKKSVKYNANYLLSRNVLTGRDSNIFCHNENSRLLNSEMIEPSGSINGTKKNIYNNNDGTRVKILPNMLENSLVKSSNKNSQSTNISNMGETDNCQFEYDSSVNNNKNNNTENNNYNENTSLILDVEQIPIVFHNELQTADSHTAKSSNDTSQHEIIKLLRQVLEQNSVILSDIKILKEHHTLTMQNNLYKRPDGFPLTTVKEFKELETNTDRLQELLTYLKFVGGIKLREALSHFQKETMTDELTCKFTYWGRTKKSLAFYNTQVAKVFFYAAKMCPNFKGPDTRSEFKLEIMEVFRAAKQRQYLKTKDKSTAAAALETEDMFEDTVFNRFDTDDTHSIDETDDAYDET